MRRMSLAALIAVMFALSFISPFTAVPAHAADAEVPANLASPKDADKVTDQLTTFVKDINSESPEDHHAAWEMLSANGQKNLFYPGNEEDFILVKTKLFEPLGDVTINNSGGFDIEASVSGFWTPNALYHMIISFDPEYKIDSLAMLDPVIPQGNTGVTLKVGIHDGSIHINHDTTDETDITIFSISNKTSDYQTVEIDYLAAGQDIQVLQAQMANYGQQTYGFTRIAPGKTMLIGLSGLTPGTYVVATITPGTNTVPETINMYSMITITPKK